VASVRTGVASTWMDVASAWTEFASALTQPRLGENKFLLLLLLLRENKFLLLLLFFEFFWLVSKGLYLVQFCLDFGTFVLLNMYSSQDCIAKKYLQKALAVFSWRMGVQCPCGWWVSFSSSFEPPYLEKKWSAFEGFFLFL
jgi:hypothetical protein